MHIFAELDQCNFALPSQQYKSKGLSGKGLKITLRKGMTKLGLHRIGQIIQPSNYRLKGGNLAFFYSFIKLLDPLPHDKILDRAKLKAFADNKLSLTKMTVLHLIE